MIPTPGTMFSTYTVKRFTAGSWTNGVWVNGTQSTFQITASVQPAKQEDLIYLPEGQRTSAAVKIYTDTMVRTGNEKTGIQADLLEFQGEDWEIQQVWNHQELTLAHYKAIAVRKDRA